MGVPFEALLPYAIMTGFFAFSAVSVGKLKEIQNGGKKTRRGIDQWDRQMMERDRRLTGFMRGQTDKPVAPAGFELNNPWRLSEFNSEIFHSFSWARAGNIGYALFLRQLQAIKVLFQSGLWSRTSIFPSEGSAIHPNDILLSPRASQQHSLCLAPREAPTLSLAARVLLFCAPVALSVRTITAPQRADSPFILSTRRPLRATMTNNGLRTQYPYAGDTLSPRGLYEFPSPTSNYPSGIGAASPSFFPMAYQISPRFGASAFIPPPDVFVDGRRETVRENGVYTPRNSGKRSSDALHTDPVAMHLLVETAMGDSQHFDILTVEEVDALKQEQKVLDTRLGTVRRKLESETKIRDATRSLGRLASKKANGHNRDTSSKDNGAMQAYDANDQEGLESSNKKVEEFIRECLEIESRMRMIDMQLLMHTAAVLQLTHKGPKQRDEDAELSEDRFRRPDSPASLNTYEDGRMNGTGAGGFDERSLYRTPENLDNLMDVLQKGTHHQPASAERSDQALTAVATRLQEMNERLRALIIDANPDRDEGYSLPEGPPDASSIDRHLDFLDQGIRDISAEQANIRNNSRHTLSEVEGRLEGINNQLYAVLSRSDNENADKVLPPPAITGGGSTEQLNYMEDSFYNLEQIQFAMNEQINELRSVAPISGDDEMAEKYENTCKGLWEMIQKGEEEARERKRERRRLLAQDPDADEQLSPDEDNVNESYSLIAFTSKIQYLFRHASGLKEKQSVLLRQIKQQRELNSKSDAQKEADFERLNTQVLSARSEKKSMEDELERAMAQLQQFDGQKAQFDSDALRETQERNAGLEAQLINVQERVIAFEGELKEARQRAIAYENQLKDVQEQAVNYHSKLEDAEKRAAAYEEELKDHQERYTAYSVSSKEAEDRTAGYEAQVRDAQERALMLETKLREAQDEARIEAAAIQAELTESAQKIEEATTALQAVTMEKEAAEARSLDATNTLNAKEEEFRNLEGEIVRLTTELTFAKAELDGAYGTRAQRAADSAANPAIKRELDELSEQNQALLGELEALRKVQDVASQSEAEARQSERNLKAELSGMASEYEALTRDAIQNEKDRDVLESQIDKLRDEKEVLERELSDEKVKWLGVRSPGMPNGGATQLDMGATSIRMLREDFRKMMRDRTAEGLKALRAEQEERRKLEAVVRQLRKEVIPSQRSPRSNLARTMTTPQ
ncbi:involucrin repeat-containing protein [Stemphylium lycopersici]|nr:involucrin repeat-containing protein [Stemphylium lycopersici]RAR05645.1 involucrin repeat-containing protein [Stemphylium lycopersici]